MEVTAYLKQECGWSRGVREVLLKYNIKYEEKQIHIEENYKEMILKSGQLMQPTLVIDNKILSDVSGEELEIYLLKQGYEKKNISNNIPLNKSCTEEEHNQMKNFTGVPIRDTSFRGF